MTATSFDLSAIKSDVLSSAANFRQLIGLGSSATLNAGSANGVATLGADSKLTAAQIPDISLISYLGSVASQAAMLALTGQQGDWCVRSDLSTTWVITGSDPTLLANWTQLSYPSVPVQSVFGRTGAVVGVSTDYSSVGITNTAIGASNPSTGAFTTLSASSATVSAGTLNGTVLDIAQTWGGTGTYTGIRYNVTDSGPANAASLLMDLQVGGTSQFKTTKGGAVTATGRITALDFLTTSDGRGFQVWQSAGGPAAIQIGMSVPGTGSGSDMWFSTTSNLNTWIGRLSISSSTGTATFFGDVHIRNSTTAMKQYVFNIYTNDSNYERAKIAWESNVLRIGTEKLGTGAARALELQTDGTTRLTIDTSGFVYANGGKIGLGSNGNALIETTSQTSNVRLGFNNAARLQIDTSTITILDSDIATIRFGSTASFPGIKRNSAALNFRLADDSGDCDITAAKATLSATLDLTIRTVTYGATMAIDAALGNKIAITLGGNGTISNPTNAVDGRVLVFRLRQDGSGNRVPVWDTKYAFVGDLATVTLSTAANKIDRVAFEYDSTDDKWYCISFIKGS